MDTRILHFLNRNASLLIFAVALLVRLAVLYGMSPPADLYHNEMHRAAQSLAAEGTLANPYPCPTGPTAHVAPGYAGVLAIIYRSSTRPEVWIGVATCLISALTYGLLPWLSATLAIGRHIGVIAGFVGALVPWLPGMEARGSWEASWAAFLLVVAAGLTARGQTVLSGLAWGATFLFAPALLPVLIVILAFQRKKGLLIATIAMAVVSPWIVRNYIQFDRVFWIRSNLGLELFISNHPRAVAYAPNNVSPEYHPAHGHGPCLLLQNIGEAAFMEQQKQGALDWIRNNPGDFARLTVLRFWYYWDPPYGSLLRHLIMLLTTLLSLIGTALIVARNRHARGLLLGVVVAFPAIYYFIQADPRYRAPIQPVMLLGLAVAVSAAQTRLFKSKASLEQPSLQ